MMLQPKPFKTPWKGRTLKDKQASNGRTLALNGKAWRTLRAYVLSAESTCRHCSARGLVVVATDVDHHDNDPTNNELSNLVPLCHDCHSRKTAREMGSNVAMGCDLSGKPLDPYHHWNKPARAALLCPAAIQNKKSPGVEAQEPTAIFPINANRQNAT